MRACDTADRRQYAPAAGFGLLFVLVELADAVVMAAAGSPPSARDSAGLAGYLVQHQTAFVLDTWLFGVGAALFIAFAAGLGRALDRRAAGSGALITALGTSWAAIVTVSAALLGAAALVAGGAGAGSAGAFRELGGILFGSLGLFPMAGLMLATSYLVLRSAVLPAWTGYVGVITAILNLIATFSVLAGDSDSSFSVNGMAGQVFGAFAYILWTASVSVALMSLRSAE